MYWTRVVSSLGIDRQAQKDRYSFHPSQQKHRSIPRWWVVSEVYRDRRWFSHQGSKFFVMPLNLTAHHDGSVLRSRPFKSGQNGSSIFAVTILWDQCFDRIPACCPSCFNLSWVSKSHLAISASHRAVGQPLCPRKQCCWSIKSPWFPVQWPATASRRQSFQEGEFSGWTLIWPFHHEQLFLKSVYLYLPLRNRKGSCKTKHHVPDVRKQKRGVNRSVESCSYSFTLCRVYIGNDD